MCVCVCVCLQLVASLCIVHPYPYPSLSLFPSLQPFSTAQHQSTSTSESGEGSGKPHHHSDGKHHSKKPTHKKQSHSCSDSNSPTPDSAKKRRCSNSSSAGTSDKEGEKKLGEPSVFTFDTSQLHPSHHLMPPPPTGTMQDIGTMTAQEQGGVGGAKAAQRNATLDDLCRAVEALEKMESRNSSGSCGSANTPAKESCEEDDKRRPENIQIPTHTSPSLDRERHRFESTPPYTPPPILSPARALALQATPGTPGTASCSTPSRILQPWSCRRTSDHRKPSEAEDGFPEPKINVGKQFQAVLPQMNGT